MPSNVRQYDTSCKNLAKPDRVFYQCIVCDPLKRLFICQNCKFDGQHEGHPLIESKDTDSIRFCNCGDRTGVYECQRHKRCDITNEDRPLHYDELGLLKFTKSFNMVASEARILSRLYQIRSVEMSSTDGRIIENYFINSNFHNYKEFVLLNCWSAYRKDREINFVDKGYDQTRRLLLWHGTRKQNLSGILQQGFRKPDDKTVAHGSKFGRGVYFADRVSKSASYCDRYGYGLLLLCEVALGSMWRTGLPKCYKDVPPEFDSIKGVGKSIPDKSGNTKFGDVIVPSGKTVKSSHPKIKYSKLDCNEYIVFDPDRILIKFILTFKLKPTECLIQ